MLVSYQEGNPTEGWSKQVGWCQIAGKTYLSMRCIHIIAHSLNWSDLEHGIEVHLHTCHIHSISQILHAWRLHSLFLYISLYLYIWGNAARKYGILKVFGYNCSLLGGTWTLLWGGNHLEPKWPLFWLDGWRNLLKDWSILKMSFHRGNSFNKHTT